MKVTHLITTLDIGGAEMMLFKLLSGPQRSGWTAEVISLTNIGGIGEKIRRLGVPVRALGMRRGVPNPLRVLRLASWLRQSRPQLLQTWMYHADLIGGLAAELAGGPPVAWNLRQSNLDPDLNKRLTLWTMRACARLSRRLPARIICCAESARIAHARLGYAAEKITVIPNGFDLETFKPDPAAPSAVRQELGIGQSSVLIGLIARFDPQKDHRTFIQAAAQLCMRIPDVHFLLCGEGIDRQNRPLSRWIEDTGFAGRFHLLGPRDDVPRIMASLDIACSSSRGEGFPSALGEAMACGVPCVATDVGDSAALVGDTGYVVPAGNPGALVAACQTLMAGDRSALGLKGRLRIEKHFSLAAVSARYQSLYEEVAG